jgi:hypothetical protein
MNVSTVSTDIERLMGRAILDEAFRHQLFINPEAAVREAGLILSDVEMAHLKDHLDQIKKNQTTEQFNASFGELPPRPLTNW